MGNERPAPRIEDTDGTRSKLEAWFSEVQGNFASQLM